MLDATVAPRCIVDLFIHFSYLPALLYHQSAPYHVQFKILSVYNHRSLVELQLQLGIILFNLNNYLSEKIPVYVYIRTYKCISL